MKRILVTGASGYIGARTLAPLRALGFEVHASARRARRDTEVAWHEADLLVPGAAAALVATVRPTHLLHAAWIATPGVYVSAPENLHWLTASLELASAFADAGGERMVGVGTCFEYGPTAGPCDEQRTPLHPNTFYGACKAATWHALDGLLRARSVEFAWARVFYLFGGDEAPQRLVPSLIDALAAGRVAECTAGTQRRDFLHVDDVGRAIASLAASAVVGAVNIGSGRAITLRALIEEIARQMDESALVRFGARPIPPNDPPELVPSVERLAREVGFAPELDLAAGVAAAIAARRRPRAA
jgi:nucleoside-diphosphate-sugar epimerase